MSTISQHGYVLVYVGKDHHLADVRGYAYEHRLIAEKKLGRRLKKNELVHHLDENRKNNTMKGRRLPQEKNIVIFCGCGCGGRFTKYDGNGRPRIFLKGHWRKGKKGGWIHAS
jgi:hypothetical protein